MSKGKAKEFYEQADDFRRYITKNVITTDKIPSLMKLLMTLYLSALHLPDTEPETNGVSWEKAEDVSIRIDEQISTIYWEVYNPYVYEELVCGDLVDDLLDIVKDLRVGMDEYEAGRFGNAIFVWKWGLDNHWGQHIVDDLRALHTARSR